MTNFTLPVHRDDVIRFETQELVLWVWDNPSKLNPSTYKGIFMVIDESKRVTMKFENQTNDGWRYINAFSTSPMYELIILK